MQVILVCIRHDDHYTWNKATACIHNLLSGQRWVENYGEVLIDNGTKCCCKLIFSRVSVSHIDYSGLSIYGVARLVIGALNVTKSVVQFTMTKDNQ